MKNICKFTKKIFVFSLVSMMTLGAFCVNAQVNSSKNIKTTTNNENFFLQTVLQKSAYEKQASLIDNQGKKQAATGKYANATKDNKVKWNITQSVNYEPTPIAIDMFKKITLDGKKITLPTTFASLGANYAEFDKFDFTTLKEGSALVVLENTKNKMAMAFENIFSENITIAQSGFEDSVIRGDLFQNYKYEMAAGVDVKNKKVVGLYSCNNALWGRRNIKVDGIGIGNTFNEMYAKFGTPATIRRQKINDYYFTSAMYGYVDDAGNMCVVYFNHTDKVFDSRGYKSTKPNVITDVNVDFRFKKALKK